MERLEAEVGLQRGGGDKEEAVRRAVRRPLLWREEGAKLGLQLDRAVRREQYRPKHRLPATRIAHQTNRLVQLDRLGAFVEDTVARVAKEQQRVAVVAEELDRNVDMLLSHHEQDFFAAYKSHMAQVQKDYRDLKQKADQNETRARRDHKIKELEKELQELIAENTEMDTAGAKIRHGDVAKRISELWKGLNDEGKEKY